MCLCPTAVELPSLRVTHENLCVCGVCVCVGGGVGLVGVLLCTWVCSLVLVCVVYCVRLCGVFMVRIVVVVYICLCSI